MTPLDFPERMQTEADEAERRINRARIAGWCFAGAVLVGVVAGIWGVVR